MTQPAEGVGSNPLNLDPEDLFVVAGKFAEQGRYEEAVALYERGVKLFPGSLAMKIGLGKMRNLLKEKDEHERHRLMAKFKEERGRQDRQSSQLAAIGEIFERKGQSERARECYRIALIHNPSNESARFNLAKLDYRNNDFSGSIRELKALSRRARRRRSWRTSSVAAALVISWMSRTAPRPRRLSFSRSSWWTHWLNRARRFLTISLRAARFWIPTFSRMYLNFSWSSGAGGRPAALSRIIASTRLAREAL